MTFLLSRFDGQPVNSAARSDRSYAFALGPIPNMDALADQWRRFDATGNHSFFLTWTWIGTWLSTLPESVRPQLLQVLREGEIVGLAVLVSGPGPLHRLMPVQKLCFNCSGQKELDRLAIEHNGFATPTDDAAIWPAFVNWFACETPSADELIIPGLSTSLEHGTPKSALLWTIREMKAYRTSLRTIAAEGMDMVLSRNARQQLRRSQRAYEDRGPITILAARDTKEALAFYEALKTFHARTSARRERSNPFHNPYFDAFHRRLIVTGGPIGAVDLLRVSVGERAFGYLYNFRKNGHIYSYQSGFDESDLASRPGYVCHATALAHYAEQGAEWYDFMAGHNQLKQTFAPTPYTMTWYQLRKPHLGFRAEAAARSAVRRLRQLAGR